MTRTRLHRDDLEKHGTNGMAVGLLVLVLATVTALLAISRDAGQAPDIRSAEDCASISDGGARLDCYDRAARRKPGEPAKGTNAHIE